MTAAARPHDPEQSAAGTGAIALDAVRFTWPGDSQPVIAIDEFHTAGGESVFLRGASGFGKSTLLNLIGGTLHADQGRIVVDGVDLGTLREGARDRFRVDRIGLVFQQFNLLPFVLVLDNVLLPCRFSVARKSRACAVSGTLEADADRLLDGQQISPALRDGRDVTRLSVGQQQRVAVARALVGRHLLVIADEPTSALDADTRERFLELLIAEVRAAGASLLFVSHDRSLASAFGSATPADTIRALHLEPRAVTVLLVELQRRTAVFCEQRWINTYREEPLLAVLPGVALAELWNLVSVAETALRVVSGFVVLASLVNLVSVLLAGLEARRREMARLRASGASPAQIFLLLTLESTLLTVSGVLLGMGLLIVLTRLGGSLIERA